MKRSFLIAVSVLFTTYTSSAMAGSQSTPAVKSFLTSSSPRSLLRQVHMAMKQQWQKIALDQRNGKLTSEQATT
jgi:hypothetical protein